MVYHDFIPAAADPYFRPPQTGITYTRRLYEHEGMHRTATDRPLASATVEDAASTSVVVCELVSRVSDTPVRDLPPLEDAIDADCLDTVFAGQCSDGHVSFQFAGYDVIARSCDTVELYTEATVTA